MSAFTRWLQGNPNLVFSEKSDTNYPQVYEYWRSPLELGINPGARNRLSSDPITLYENIVSLTKVTHSWRCNYCGGKHDSGDSCPNCGAPR